MVAEGTWRVPLRGEPETHRPPTPRAASLAARFPVPCSDPAGVIDRSQASSQVRPREQLGFPNREREGAGPVLWHRVSTGAGRRELRGELGDIVRS